MNYQVKQDEKRKFKGEMWKIDKSNQILDELERKMYHHFERKKTEEHLLNSQDGGAFQQPQLPTKGKNTFKLFAKTSAVPMSINELQGTPSKDIKKEYADHGKSQVGQLIEQVEAIQTLVRKKLALKQQRIAQLQREISLQSEQKIHLYRINCQLEEELVQFENTKQHHNQQILQEQKLLQEELKRLKKIYDNKKIEQKRLKKQEEMLKVTLKDTQNNRKGYIEAEIKTSNSRPKLPKKQQKQQEHYLRGLVIELDRLKQMVRQKMKKSSNKLKLK